MRRILQISVILSLIIALYSCDDENHTIDLTSYSIKVILPDSLYTANLAGTEVKVRNTQTGAEVTLITDSKGEIVYNGIPGVYNIIVSGTKEYTFINSDGKETHATAEIVGYRENMLLHENVKGEEIKTSIKIASKGWVIKEIYFTGVRTPKGGSYTKDQYIEIYNNTDSVLYADGICIAETANNTQSNEINIYAPEIDKETYIRTVYAIPGTGRDVPVGPGKSLLIAPQPINHKEENENSFDLSMADYQWFDKSNISIDVPEVPNLDRHYSYSKTIWLLSTRGYQSMLIFRVEGSIDQYVEDYTDKRLNTAGKKAIAIRLPNEFILDAVELGSQSDFKSKSLSSSVDVGYTYCDAANTGKSVRRKVKSVEADGRVIYEDTNNSAFDFIPNADPQPKIFKAE